MLTRCPRSSHSKADPEEEKQEKNQDSLRKLDPDGGWAGPAVRPPRGQWQEREDGPGTPVVWTHVRRPRALLFTCLVSSPGTGVGVHKAG